MVTWQVTQKKTEKMEGRIYKRIRNWRMVERVEEKYAIKVLKNKRKSWRCRVLERVRQ